MFIHENLFGGAGQVTVWDLLGAQALDPFRAALACELAPGGRVGTHVQEAFPELVIFTGGQGAVEVDGVARAVAPGAVVALGLGMTLAIANVSVTDPLTYLIVKASKH
ncbi:MAG: hypothetical protein JWM80_2342 [Cyanobacteria bacterium RYN_339]|nr:hypothetical protein [Cyanobacteria bacterium RYN_339]